MKIAAVIPAYNEEASITGVVEAVHQANEQLPFELIPVVVNDCSKDQTAAIIRKLDCVDLHLPVNLGIGGAVQCGYKYAYANDFDRAVQIDGDGQHPPIEIARLAHQMTENNLDVVIGSRFIEGSGFQSTILRRMGINYFKWLNKFLLGITVFDNTSGMRMLNRKALSLVVKYYPDEYPEPESLVLFVKQGLKVGEVQVQMRERQGGESSIGATASVYYMLKVSLAIVYTYIRLTFQKIA